MLRMCWILILLYDLKYKQSRMNSLLAGIGKRGLSIILGHSKYWKSPEFDHSLARSHPDLSVLISTFWVYKCETQFLIQNSVLYQKSNFWRLCSNMNICIFNRLTNFNTHTTKKFTPQNSSWYWRTNCILHSIWFCDSDTWKCNVRTVTQNLGISIQIPISGFNFRCNPFSKINFQFEPILPECIEVNFRWSLLKHLPQRKSLSMQKMQIYGP